VIAHANDAIISKTLDGLVLSWNPAAEKLFGHSAGEMIGQPIARLFPADRLHEEAALISQLQAGADITHFETQRLRKDGALIDVSVTLSPLWDADGHLVAVSKIARDITDRQCLRAAAELAVQLRHGLDESSLRISLWGTDERNLYANAPYAAAWNLTPAQLLGKHFSEVLAPAVYAQAKPMADAARAGEPQLFQRAVAWPDGKTRWELVNLIPGPHPTPGAGNRRGLFMVITDITSEVQAQQAAVDAAAHARRLYEATPAMVHASDLDGRLLAVSDTWLKQLGYARGEVVGTDVADYLTPQSRTVREAARVRLAQGDPCEGVALEAVCKSGQLMAVLMSAMVERDATGQAMRVLTVLQDVTDRLRAERALQKSEALLNRTGALAGVGGWEQDLASQRITWSEQMYRIHGVAADHTPTLASALAFYPPEARATLEAAIGRATASGESWDLELPFVRADGQPMWVRTVGRVEHDNGSAARLVGAFQDITDRWLLALNLSEQQRFISQVMAVSPEGLYTSALSGHCTYANATWRTLAGLPLAQGNDVDLHQLIHPDDWTAVQAHRQAALAEGGVHTSEHRYRRPDGSVIWVRELLTLLRPGEAEGGFVGSVEDVTERRQLDAALAAKTIELARSNEELERFAYVASHDLQEPLRMVNSYGQLLLRRHGGALPAEAQEFLHFMVDGGQRAQVLIRDLLSLARIDSQAQRWEPVALDAVLADALRDLADRVHQSGAIVTHGPLPTLAGDAAQLRQLLGNLLSNALKFSGPAAPVVHVSAERQGALWRISIRDEGIGIDPKFFERIFVMFQRLHLRGEHEGTGIGLAICTKVVERHGGRLGVDSQPGQGATFFFTVPDHGQAALALPPPGDRSPP
jgi:PAS domain S-box-containing protein